MGQPGGPSYDGDAMKAIARDTEELGAAFGKAKKPVETGEATAASFGLLGGETLVGEVFENTRDRLVTSLGKAERHARELAEGARTSFADMDTRDAAQSQNLGELQGEV
ncbi:hypothetical protein [Haloactinomyces albus]|uniref:Excreted virulence factor EspC, type VII ESX diderm n=1 Tax=Haloactinomyces albus TaxID=1352928 RepID=A0AAE4CQB9_9ACTN|nr:hypothetical protein [Haloactinomyces albus]MDR7302518.1 hypothetical protein [Haloactinomyces albus]